MAETLTCYACDSPAIGYVATPNWAIYSCAEHAEDANGYWLLPQIKITAASTHHARQYSGNLSDHPGSGGKAFAKEAGK